MTTKYSGNVGAKLEAAPHFGTVRPLLSSDRNIECKIHNPPTPPSLPSEGLYQNNPLPCLDIESIAHLTVFSMFVMSSFLSISSSEYFSLAI